jgi:hypothetical protein
MRRVWASVLVTVIALDVAALAGCGDESGCHLVPVVLGPMNETQILVCPKDAGAEHRALPVDAGYDWGPPV